MRAGRALPEVDRELVLKPWFGSWGLDVRRVSDSASLARTIADLDGCSWYERHGALPQDLVPPQGYDLRVLVAAGSIVGAVYRVAAAGEWRTNVALGGVRRPVSAPPLAASTLALAAAAAVGASLVGVDLLPDGRAARR